MDRVSKRFWLSHQRTASLKERVLGAATRHASGEALWALRDVSLEIPRGETFGLIGPNGCGKSTLLQLVAGVLEPDGGSVTTSGRVTSLLELGAGFSPDLTGRENIFLNASLYGVPRDVIATRFDAIVAFSELDRFIDMPVRTYSSGMYMRLGFAVADPVSGSRMPATICSSVLLPQPFGPISPNVSPRGISSETSRSAHRVSRVSRAPRTTSNARSFRPDVLRASVKDLETRSIMTAEGADTARV